MSNKMNVELRGGKLTADFATCDRKGDSEIRKLQEQEAILCLEGTGLEGVRKNKVQAWNLLSEEAIDGAIAGTHIAAPTLGNGIEAARKRHFKIGSGVGEPTDEGLASANYACAKLVQFLQQDACDHGHIRAVFDELCTKPEIFKSGKWTKERFLEGLRKAGIATTDTLPPRSFAVKPKEALGKKKPRGIISTGDAGVVLHIFDAATFEKILFHNRLFEARSIKHAELTECSKRVGDFIRSYDFTASTDFGAFDGSCTSKIRDCIENAVLTNLFSNILGDRETLTSILREAMMDRTKEDCRVKLGAFIRMHVKDMIRESGDRGTSILNFLTNYVLFLAAAHLVMTRMGIDKKTIDRVITASIKSGDFLNLMAEGDDGAQGFMKKFVMLVANDIRDFGKKWMSAYEAFGYKIEPQGPLGEVPFSESIMTQEDRLEFCSKVFVCSGNETYLFPKPSKFF